MGAKLNNPAPAGPKPPASPAPPPPYSKVVSPKKGVRGSPTFENGEPPSYPRDREPGGASFVGATPPPTKTLSLVVLHRADGQIDFEGLSQRDRDLLRSLCAPREATYFPSLLARVKEAGYAIAIRTDLQPIP
jgi:hypothetical protein